MERDVKGEKERKRERGWVRKKEEVGEREREQVKIRRARGGTS